LVSPGQQVVRSGPCRWIRHPAYSGSLLTLLGLGLALANRVSLLGFIALTLSAYGHRIRVEEKALCDALGEPYLCYMRKTKRFIPYLF
jgi:protein-S-isoprenylcysteine O-methyltransferase Ste14